MWRWWRYWPTWSAYAAAIWSIGYGGLGVYWALGGRDFPFATVANDRSTVSILEGTPARVVAPVIAAVGLVGGVVAIAMIRPTRRFRLLLLGFGWACAVVDALLVPDYSLLAMVALSPLLIVFAFTGVPGPQQTVGAILYWHRLNLVIVFVGGLLWAAATLAYQRRTSGACANCGRRGERRTSWDARKWGHLAVLVAAASTIPYEATRIAWFFGLPLGITPAFYRMMADTPHMLDVGLGLAVAGLCGSVLTHGLVRRWGEVYPRWVFFRAGRPVPPMLAVIPAGLVATVLIPAGLMNFRLNLRADLWAVTVPGMLWVVWGAALGVATYAYYLRRRPPCGRCDYSASDGFLASTAPRRNRSSAPGSRSIRATSTNPASASNSTIRPVGQRNPGVTR